MTLYATPFITAEHMTYSTSIAEDLFNGLTGMSMQAYADDQQQKLESGEYEYQTFTATPEPKQTTILVKKQK